MLKPKFCLGESVRIKSGEFAISGSISDSSKVNGVKGIVKSISANFPSIIVYEVLVETPFINTLIKVREDGLEKVDSVKGMSEEQAEKLNDMMRKLRENIRMHLISTEMPDLNSWLRSFVEQKPIDVKIEFADILKKWDERLPLRSGLPKLYIGKFKLNEEALKQMQELLSERPYVVSKPAESKMTKARCIKLLESYRAEREKIAKGRKFERCLRENVVNEALERAIELLKGGNDD